MSQDRLIKLGCGKCKRINYLSIKNKKLIVEKLELNKYCKWCKKKTKHKEANKYICLCLFIKSSSQTGILSSIIFT